MFNFLKAHKRLVVSAGILVLAALGVYLFLTFTHQGRLLSLYTVGGWSAPRAIRSECRALSYARVAELFTKPLDMNDEAKQGLREYWHYSYYRECLYHAGYTFMGKPLAQSTLEADTSGVNLRYMNPLAGISIIVPADSTLTTTNELDVMFDYRLLRSTLRFATTTLLVDTYTDHEFIRTFGDLPTYLDHFPASQSAFTLSEHRTTQLGVPYLYVETEDHMCGAILVTPEARIAHLYAACADKDTVLAITDTLTFEAESASVH